MPKTDKMWTKVLSTAKSRSYTNLALTRIVFYTAVSEYIDFLGKAEFCEANNVKHSEQTPKKIQTGEILL